MYYQNLIIIIRLLSDILVGVMIFSLGGQYF